MSRPDDEDTGDARSMGAVDPFRHAIMNPPIEDELRECVREINLCIQEILEKHDAWVEEQWASILDAVTYSYVDVPGAPNRKDKRTKLPDDEAAAAVNAKEAEGKPDWLVARPYNDKDMRELLIGKATALHALAVLEGPREKYAITPYGPAGPLDQQRPPLGSGH